MKKIFLVALTYLSFIAYSQYCPSLGPNQLLPCGVTSTTLTADLSQCGQGSNPNQTTNYSVTNIPYIAQVNSGTQLFMTDDSQQGPFNIGFSFCYFGQTYTQFWVGSNGWISFSAGQPVTFTSSPIPNAGFNIPKNCIMGPWQDWHPGVGGQIRYQVQGVAPCRKLVVSWINMPMFGCTATLGTFHIVIYESTNYIENHIQSKQFCNWANGTAVQGIHNLPGTVGIAVPGRNSTQWTATNNAYRWTPSGPVVTPTITWYQVGNPIPIATGVNTITVTPPVGGANYTCHLEYPTCNAGWSTCNAGAGLGPDTVFVAPGPPNLPPPNIILQDPHCNNGCDGTITINPNGGTGITTISWSGGNTNFTLNNLCSGNYTFTLVDQAGCTYNGSATLINPPVLSSPLVTPTNPTCFQYCDGQATVNPTSGVAPYTFVWSNGQTNQTATGLCSGTFNVTVFDNFNCQSQTSVTLVDPPQIIITSILGSDTVCFNSTSNIFTTSSIFPGLNYIWSNTIGNITSGQGTNQINLDVQGVSSGLYTNTLQVIGQTQLGCQSPPQLFTIVDLNILPIINPVGPFCEYNSCINLLAQPGGGTFAGLNVWNNQYCPDNGFIGIDSVSYAYTQSGCWFNTNIPVQVYPRPYLETVIDGRVGAMSEYHEICEGDSIMDLYEAQSPSGGYNEWYVFGDTLQGSSINITWNQDGIFQFQVVRWDNGCVSLPTTITVSLELCPNEIFYIPNAFTPDGDEHNNLFKPTITSGVDVNNYTFTIWNRWGEIIWQSHNPEIGWDGTYNNINCQEDIYIWKLHFKNPKDDGQKEFYGHVSLIK